MFVVTMIFVMLSVSVVILLRQIDGAEVQLRLGLPDRLRRNRPHLCLIEEHDATLLRLHCNHFGACLLFGDRACFRMAVVVVRTTRSDDADEYGERHCLFETRGGKDIRDLILDILHFHDVFLLCLSAFMFVFIIADGYIIRGKFKQSVNTKITFLKFLTARRFFCAFRL